MAEAVWLEANIGPMAGTASVATIARIARTTRSSVRVKALRRDESEVEGRRQQDSEAACRRAGGFPWAEPVEAIRPVFKDEG